MRLSNWCMLFVTMFLVVTLMPNLREKYSRQALFTTTQYNRNVDRATEDALLTCVEREEIDGSLQMSSSAVKERFLAQLELQFETGHLEENVLYGRLVNEKEMLSLEQERALQEEMETGVNGKSCLEETSYVFLFPEQEKSDFSQPLQNHSFYQFLELPDKEKYRWSRFFYKEPVRFWLSGAMVQKKMAP